jgi:hypothetical protein
MQWDLEAFLLTQPIYHAFPRGVAGRFELVWIAPVPRPLHLKSQGGENWLQLSDDVIFRCRGRGSGRFNASGSSAWKVRAGKGGKYRLARNLGM